MRRILSLFFLSLMALVLLGAVAFGILLARFNPNDYQQQVSEAVERATGRQLRFEGAMSMSFFPSVSLKTGALVLSEPGKFGPDPFLRVENARLQIALDPLWEGVIQVDEILLEGARLKLATAIDGSHNWEYGFGRKDAGNTLLYRHTNAPEPFPPAVAPGASAAPDESLATGAPDGTGAVAAAGTDAPRSASSSPVPSPASAAASDAQGGEASAVIPLQDSRRTNTPDVAGSPDAEESGRPFGRERFSLQVSRIACLDARILYRDMRDGTSWSGTLDTVSVGDARLDAEMPFSLSGSLRDDVSVGKAAFSLRGMAHIGRAGDVAVRVTDFDSTVDSLTSAPVRLRASALAAYEGGERLLRVEQLEGELLMPAPEQESRSGTSAADASLLLRTAFRGEMTCSSFTADRPRACRGELGLDEVDLDAMLGRLTPARPVTDPQAATQGAPNLTNPMVRKPRSGSRTPVLPPAGPGAQRAQEDSQKAAPDPGGPRVLRLPDLELALLLRIDSLRLHSLPLRDVAFRLEYKDRQAFLPYEARLFDGSLSGTAKLALRKGEPAMTVSCVAKEVDLEQATKTLSGKYTIIGRLRVTLDFSGRGSTSTEFLHSVNGTVTAKVGNGEIRGFRLLPANLPVVRPLPTDFPFTSMSLSAQIKEGLATSRDISLQSPVVTVRGGGSAHLAYSQLDLGLEFLPAGRPPAIPLGISGPYNSLSYSVDMPTFLRNVAEGALDSQQGGGRLIREVGGLLFRQ